MYSLDSPNTLTCNLYTAEQIRHGEVVCAQAHGIDMYQLMEKAGHAVFECVLAYYQHAKNILILAGKGNNGGDAYVVARLALLSGIQVLVIDVEPTKKPARDADIARQAFLAKGGKVLTLANLTAEIIRDADLVIDGVFGTGFRGVLDEELANWFTKLNQSALPVIAIDIPSGLEADTGFACPSAIHASYTVTFIAGKPGLFTGDGPNHCGNILYTGLGISDTFVSQYQPHSLLYSKHSRHVLPHRSRTAHKGHFGHIVCVGGNRGMAGAIMLAAMAALRSGAGKVTVLTHHDHASTIAANSFELMVRGIAPSKDWKQFDQLVASADAIVLGPGLGLDDWAKSVFNRLIALPELNPVPIVIDADGLNLLAQHKGTINKTLVLTPHPLEAARLLDTTVTEVQKNRFVAVQQLAQKYAATIVLKGAGSLIYQTQIAINRSGNPGMATAGMGDVLSGVIGTFVQNNNPYNLSLEEQVRLAVYLHGLSGDFAAKNGEIGIIASDVIEQLPNAIARCQKTTELS